MIEKHLPFVGFILVLVVIAYIVLNLSVGWFTIVVPIFAAIIFFLILTQKDETEKDTTKK